MILQTVFLFSTFNFLFLSLILIFKKSLFYKANRILGLTFLTMTLYSFTLLYLNYSIFKGNTNLLKYFIPIDNFLAMLMGPLIFFYIKTLLGIPVKIKTFKTWLHFLPTVPSLVYIVYFILKPEQTRINELLSSFESMLWQLVLLNSLFFIQMFIYLFVCYSIVNKQIILNPKIKVQEFYYNIKWLKTYFLIDLALMFIAVPLSLLLNNNRVNLLIGLSVMAIQFNYIFIKTLWTQNLFSLEKIN